MADDTLPQPPSGGMLGGLSQLAYGTGASPMSQVGPLLDAMLPAKNEANEWLAYGAGMGKPTRTGALTEAMSNGMEGQLEARNTRDKLRAAYMPLIMNALVQNQQLTLGAANAGRDYLKDIVPKIDSHLSSMRTGNAKPTHEAVSNRLLQLGNEYQVPSHILFAKLQSLPKDPDELSQYLDRLAVGGAGADKQLPSVSTNAAGQQTSVNPTRGTSQVLGEPSPAPRPGEATADPSNPSKVFVDWQQATKGDVKTYEEGLRGRADAYRTMLARMNEQGDYVKQFQPGRYAKLAGGVAAAVKDIGSRLPGIDKKTVEDLAGKLVGSKEGSPEALAAQQIFEQLAQQESIAQLKSSLGEGQRMNLAEYSNFAKTNLGQAMDPETFKAMRNFYYKQAAEASNRYSDWADYVRDPSNKNPSVTHFDASHTKKEFEHLLKGDSSVREPEAPNHVEPKLPKEVPAPATPAVQAPAAAAKKADVDLALYEPTAKVGPTGKVYVLENGVPRPAKLKGSSAPKGSALPVTLNGQGPR